MDPVSVFVEYAAEVGEGGDFAVEYADIVGDLDAPAGGAWALVWSVFGVYFNRRRVKV